MKPRYIAALVVAVTLTGGSLAAHATKAPTMTEFAYYDSGWKWATVSLYPGTSCNDGAQNCYYLATYCAGYDPDNGDDLFWEFDFSSSGTYEDGRMYEDLYYTDVLDSVTHWGSEWYMNTNSVSEIDWNLSTSAPYPTYVGWLRLSLDSVNYTTYVYVRRIVCK